MNSIYLTYIIVFVVLTVGFYNITLSVLQVPTNKANKTMLKVANQGKISRSLSEYTVVVISNFIANFVYLTDYKRSKLKSTLVSAKISMKPEIYVARAIAKSLMLLIFIIPCYFILPIMIPLVILLFVLKYFSEMQYADEVCSKNKEKIEYELPRFSSTIAQELINTRDILQILENFSASVNGILREELEITIADMRTGNYQKALLKMEKRVNSTMLSEILRGLISSINGDDNVIYFKMLSMKLKDVELLKLKGEANKRPKQIQRYSMLLLFTFIGTYVVMLGLQLFESMNKMF